MIITILIGLSGYCAAIVIERAVITEGDMMRLSIPVKENSNSGAFRRMYFVFLRCDPLTDPIRTREAVAKTVAVRTAGVFF